MRLDQGFRHDPNHVLMSVLRRNLSQQKGFVPSRAPEGRLVASEARLSALTESINQTRESPQATFLKEPSKLWPEHHHTQRQPHNADGNREEKRRQERIIEEKESVFQLVDHPSWRCSLDRNICVVDYQHITIAFIKVSSPIACSENGRSKGFVSFFGDQTSFLQVSADGISFQINSGRNVMGGKMVRRTDLNPAIIGCLSNPD